jgi:uncharacterized damage-inducible protein DinB
MRPFFTDYLNNLLELHGDIRGALQGLPQDALDWSPGAEMNSLNVLVVHLTGAERYWIGDVVAGEPSGRDRAAEFRVSGLSTDELLRRLSDIEILAQRVLGPFALQALEEKRVSPRDGREFTVAWALGHALKHTALHLGQIQITRQLWEQAQTK